MPHSIDYGNSITSGLVAAYVFVDGSLDNLVNGSDTLTITGDAFLDADGLNSPITGSYTGAVIDPLPSAFKPNSATVMWFGKILGNGNIFNNAPLISIYWPFGSPYVSYGIHRNNVVGQGGLYGLYSESTNSHNISASGAIDTGAYGTNVNYLFTRTSGASALYKDGSLIGSDSVSGNISYDVNARLYINRALSSSDSANTDTALVFIWNRVLTSGEIASLASNAYVFLTTGTTNNGTCDISLNLNTSAIGNIIKNANCQITLSLNETAAAQLTVNRTATIELNLNLSGLPVKTINASCTITNELKFDIIGQSNAVKLDCIAGKDKLPTDPTTAGSSNSAYFS